MKKIRISMLVLFALTAVGVSTSSFSFEPGVQQKYLCTLHNDSIGIKWGGGLITSSDRNVCIAKIRDANQWQGHENEMGLESDNHSKSVIRKTIHVPEHCATLDPFY